MQTNDDYEGKTFLTILLLLGCSACAVYFGYTEVFEVSPQIREVQSSWVRETAHIKKCGVSTKSKRRRGSIKKIGVEYTYSYNGNTYTSKNPGWYSKQDAKMLEDVIDKYNANSAYRLFAPQKGAEDSMLDTECWVNPKSPENSVLYCNPDEDPFGLGWCMMIGGSLVFSLIIAGIGYSIYDSIKKRKS